jgi:hypothetical protein
MKKRWWWVAQIVPLAAMLTLGLFAQNGQVQVGNFPGIFTSLKIGSGQVMTNPPEMVAYLGTVSPTTLNATTNVPVLNISPITINRVEWQLTAQCTVAATFTIVFNGVAQSYTITAGTGTFSGHTDGTLNVPAGSPIGLKTTTAGTTCGAASITVHYTMQ